MRNRIHNVVMTAWVAMTLAGCGGTPAVQPSAASSKQAEAAAAKSALAELPEAQRREAEEAAAITTFGKPAPASENELAPLRAMMVQARELLGLAPAFRNEAELVPYLSSLVQAKPVESYDRAGFLRGLGIQRPISAGKTDDATFAAVRQIVDYTPGTWFGGEEYKSQLMAWKIAKTFPKSYATLAKAVNPSLEAVGRMRRGWAKPFEVRQKAHPTGQAATDRYTASAAAFRVLFDPDVHSGVPGTAPEGRRPYGTYYIAQTMGFTDESAGRVGKACDDVDTDGKLPYPRTGPLPMSAPDRHFNFDRKGQDTRLVWASRHLAAAIALGRETSWTEAEVELGIGLHSLQDTFAHGQLSSYLHGTIGEFPDDVRYNPIGYVEMEKATRAYIRAYLLGVQAR